MAEFRWFGHNCVRIKAREATVLMDPLDRSTGYALPKQSADVVTISHPHPGHANLAALRPDPPYRTIEGPGEYEVHDIFVTGIRTYHDAERGSRRGYNTAYLVELENLRVCHLGDLGHGLTEDQAEALANIDVLLVPAGGSGEDVLDPVQAAEVIAQLEPKVVVPIQYRTAYGDANRGDLATFCKALGVEPPAPEEKLTVRPSDLGETMRLAVLAPDGTGRA